MPTELTIVVVSKRANGPKFGAVGRATQEKGSPGLPRRLTRLGACQSAVKLWVEWREIEAGPRLANYHRHWSDAQI